LTDIAPAARDILDVKVTSGTAAGSSTRAKVTLAWSDRAGAAHSHDFFGAAAEAVLADLRSCDAVSAVARVGYLMGLARMHMALERA
jgi:hypothetical protein